MEQKQAQKLTAAWARGITARTWPWPVPDSGHAIDAAHRAMYLQLLEYVPDDVEAAAAVWQDGRPLVVAVNGDAVLVAGCELEKRGGQAFPIARGELRCVPLDPRTATITVASTYRTSGGCTWRQSCWRFTLAGDAAPLEITAELGEDGEVTPDERLALAIADRLGWTIPEGRRFPAAA
jgi:hypothetical protein